MYVQTPTPEPPPTPQGGVPRPPAGGVGALSVDVARHADADLTRLAARVGEHLRGAGRRIATAESCTGGWIGKALTDVAGSSRWVEAGVIAYGNSAKTAPLRVLPAGLRPDRARRDAA